MAVDDAKPEVWVYAGKRLTADKKLYDLWIDAEGETKGYKKRPGILCGLYEHMVERSNDTTTVYGEPKWLSRFDQSRKEEFTVADNSARIQHTQHLRHKRAEKGTDNLEVALERLLPYARACRTKQDKDALIATVIRRLSETW